MRREEKKGEAKQTNQDPVNVRIADRFREPPLGDGLLVFVVTRPDHNGGVMDQPLDLVNSLLLHSRQEILVRGIQRASKHELLPHHQSHFIAQVVQI